MLLLAFYLLWNIFFFFSSRCLSRSYGLFSLRRNRSGRGGALWFTIMGIRTYKLFPNTSHWNSLRNRQPPAWYCASTNITYPPEFSSFVSALHSLQKRKSYLMLSRMTTYNEWGSISTYPYLGPCSLTTHANPVSCNWIYKNQRPNLMVLLNGTRLILLSRDSHKRMVSIIRRLLLLWPK